ncbi:hypothetical protein V8C40DRAFT_230362 [Trichoderma camerunense]
MWNRVTATPPYSSASVAWNFPDSRASVLDNLCSRTMSNQHHTDAFWASREGVRLRSADSSPTAGDCFSSV